MRRFVRLPAPTIADRVDWARVNFYFYVSAFECGKSTMKWPIFGQLLVVLCSLIVSCSGQNRSSDAEIKVAIAHLNNDSLESSLQLFYSNPYRSTELLIATLEPTARGNFHEHPRVVWAIRALRSLTGLDFQATTKATLTRDERNFFDPDTAGQIPFFGVWMSRDRVWVAPQDAQIAIIKKWRVWFVKHGSNYKFVDDPVAAHWYF